MFQECCQTQEDEIQGSSCVEPTDVPNKAVNDDDSKPRPIDAFENAADDAEVAALERTDDPPAQVDATDPQEEVVANDDKEIDNAPDDSKDVTEDSDDYNDNNEDSLRKFSPNQISK